MPEGVRRDLHVGIRFNEQELALVSKCASDEGRRVSEFIRVVLLECLADPGEAIPTPDPDRKSVV